jgi:hypothetical protein
MTLEHLLYASASSPSALQKAVAEVPETELRGLLTEAVTRLEAAEPAWL